MMDFYFEEVVSQLHVEDLSILAQLQQNDADAKFKAIKNKHLMELTELSEFKYKKSLERLKALQFVDCVHDEQNKKIFITRYGIEALQKSLKGVIE